MSIEHGYRLGRELIVVLADNDPQILTKGLQKTLGPLGAAVRPVFARPFGDALPAQLLSVRSSIFTVDAADESLDDIAGLLRQRPEVRAAYVKAKGDVPLIAAKLPEAGATQTDLTSLQTYLDAAPGGVGARAAWKIAGADGTDVRLTDVESNWDFAHEDLTHARGLLAGAVSGDPDHGTAVLGIIGADNNGRGMTGIAYRTSMGGAAITDDLTTAATLDAAAATLRPGDILLIEWERPRVGRREAIPIEWWWDDFVAIRSATAAGIIVVAAAGNSGENLDAAGYGTPEPGFPPEWRNPFRRELDSHAVIVGAGIPPPNTNGRTHGTDLTRQPESNYGSCVDVQGWGYEVATAGWGDRRTGAHPTQFYTEAFYATSAAAAMVAGVIASVQGARKAAGKRLWASLDARNALRDPNLGSPQTGNTAERVGPRPDLARLLALP